MTGEDAHLEAAYEERYEAPDDEPDEYWPEDCAKCHAPRTHAEERAFGELCQDCAP